MACMNNWLIGKIHKAQCSFIGRLFLMNMSLDGPLWNKIKHLGISTLSETDIVKEMMMPLRLQMLIRKKCCFTTMSNAKKNALKIHIAKLTNSLLILGSRLGIFQQMVIMQIQIFLMEQKIMVQMIVLDFGLRHSIIPKFINSKLRVSINRTSNCIPKISFTKSWAKSKFFEILLNVKESEELKFS